MMTRNSGARFLGRTSTLITLIGWSSAAAASESAGHHHPSWSMTLLAAVNFTIFALIIRRFAWPMIQSYLQDRRDRVVDALDSAATARRAAADLRAEFDLRLRSIEEDAVRTREELLTIARREAERVLAHAREAAERIRTDARLVANEEIARARAHLQQECADRVAELAGEILRREFTATDQSRFVEDFIVRTRESLS